MNFAGKLTLAVTVCALLYAGIIVSRRWFPTFDMLFIRYIDGPSLMVYNIVQQNIIGVVSAGAGAIGLALKIKNDATKQIAQIQTETSDTIKTLTQTKDNEIANVASSLTTEKNTLVDGYTAQIQGLTAEKDSLAAQFSTVQTASDQVSAENKALMASSNDFQKQIIDLQNQLKTLTTEKTILEKNVLQTTVYNSH